MKSVNANYPNICDCVSVIFEITNEGLDTEYFRRRQPFEVVSRKKENA